VANLTFRVAAQARERTAATGLMQDQAEKLHQFRDAQGGTTTAAFTPLTNNTKWYIDDSGNRVNSDLACQNIPGCAVWFIGAASRHNPALPHLRSRHFDSLHPAKRPLR